MFKLITAPLTNDRSPRYMEPVFAAFHHSLKSTECISLHFANSSNQSGLYVDFPDELEELISNPILANFPSSTLADANPADFEESGWDSFCAKIELGPDLLSLKSQHDFEDSLSRTYADPMNGILREIKPTASCRSRVEIRLKPVSAKRKRKVLTALRRLEKGKPFRRNHSFLVSQLLRVLLRRMTIIPLFAISKLLGIVDHEVFRRRIISDTRHIVERARRKLNCQLFEAELLLVVQVARGEETSIGNQFRRMLGALGAFTDPNGSVFQLSRVRKGVPTPKFAPTALLSHEELATIYHPPMALAAAERMQSTEFAEMEPPAKFYSGAERGAVAIGRALFRGDERRVGIDENSRRRHMYVVGATGTGKSTLLLNLIHQDMVAGRGLSLIDVHGDLADSMLQLVPKNRTNDAIFFDAASDHVIPFNPLQCNDPNRIDLVTSGVVSAFKKLYDSWGPRLENLLRYAVFTSVEQDGTLLDMLKLLTDKSYRDSAVLRVSDDVVRSFWINEFATWNTQYRTEAVSSVTNKLMPFLTSRQLRAITSDSAKSSLNIRQVMDEQKILIVNLSRGKLGQDNSTLLGSLLLTSIEQTALSRADIAEEDRRDHFLYLDEFQSLTTPSTAIMLSEARKYRLSLILSHQLTRQLDPATFASVIGNCGTLLSFRVGLQDAELLGPAMSKHPGQLAAADLGNLPNYTAYCRMLVDGHPSRPFSLVTLPPVSPSFHAQREAIVRQASLRQHGERMPRVKQVIEA